MRSLMITGHRPTKLGGYNNIAQHTAIQKTLEYYIYEFYTKYNCTEFISGGAIGADQIFAKAVIFIRDTYSFADMTLVIAKPFPSQSSKWPVQSRQEFEGICAKADTVLDVSDDPYSPAKMQIRNVWMVDRVKSTKGTCIALYDGSGGGTNNCIKYAQSAGVQVMVIHPMTLVNKYLV